MLPGLSVCLAAGEPRGRRQLDWLTPFSLLLASVLANMASGFLQDGIPNTCEEEGAIVQLPFNIHPCIICICTNHIVKCKKKTCPKMNDCALVVKSIGKDCCEQCKTCTFNGDIFKSGESWALDSDSGHCQHFQCQEGVVTSSSMQCEPQCDHPHRINGVCCPVCPGCVLNGAILENNETAHKNDDPCVQCTCQDGGLSCHRRTCPILSCPSYQVETPPGECCPKCIAQRRVFDLQNRCLFLGEVYEDGDEVHMDDCTECMCLSSTVVCNTQHCPSQYDCHQNQLIKEDGACCPRCSGCSVNGTNYQHNEVWMLSPCERCRCRGGIVECDVVTCESAPTFCPNPRQEVLKTPEGECCPRCVERDATCTVFGDPHYRSFDGRLFNFQGRCKYLLSADCADNSFRIRVRNDGREAPRASWSKTVFIHVGDHMITLRQGRKVRVNRTDVTMPYEIASLGNIYLADYVLTVHLDIGIKVLWDGDSFIEVTASTSFKNKLCGLCGDYDGDRINDFRTIKGAVVHDVNTFASSWQIGSKEECEVITKTQVGSPCRHSKYAKSKARKACRLLKDSEEFAACRGIVDHWVYYRSCMTDVCECGPSHTCSCEAILAYIRECQRQGVVLPAVDSGNCVL